MSPHCTRRRWRLAALLGASLSLAGAAHADDDRDKAARVRSSAAVEVIDGSRQVEDIISRMKAQARADAAAREREAAQREHDRDRPPRLREPVLPDRGERVPSPLRTEIPERALRPVEIRPETRPDLRPDRADRPGREAAREAARERARERARDRSADRRRH